MNDQLRAYLNDQAQQLDDSVRQALEICNGDPMSALRATIIANMFLHEENERLKAQISTGFARSQVRKPAAAKK